MSKNRENPEAAKGKDQKSCTLKRNEHGRMVITGPKFTKEDIARDFPDETDRDSRIMRKSVRL